MTHKLAFLVTVLPFLFPMIVWMVMFGGKLIKQSKNLSHPGKHLAAGSEAPLIAKVENLHETQPYW